MTLEFRELDPATQERGWVTVARRAHKDLNARIALQERVVFIHGTRCAREDLSSASTSINNQVMNRVRELINKGWRSEYLK